MYRRLGPDTAAAGEGGKRERRAMRVISPISLKNGLVPSRGAGRARTSRLSASRRVVAERSPNHVSSVRAVHTAQLRVVTRLPIARAGFEWSSLAPVHGGRDWRLGRRGRAVLNRHVEVAGLDPSNCHTPGAEAHQVLRHALRQMHAF